MVTPASAGVLVQNKEGEFEENIFSCVKESVSDDGVKYGDFVNVFPFLLAHRTSRNLGRTRLKLLKFNDYTTTAREYDSITTF